MPDYRIIEIDREKCILCGTCVENCPVGALAIGDDRLSVIRPEACTACGFCEDTCPTGALALRFQIIWRQVDG